MTELEKSQAKTIAQQAEIIAQQREEIRLLKEKVDYLLRQIYGSKSDKFDPSQLELLLNGEAPPTPPENEDAKGEVENIIPITRKNQTNNRRPRLPENLPTTKETIIPEEVAKNPDAYRWLGERVTQKLNVEPARYSRHIIIRPTYLKLGEDPNDFRTAALPPCLLEGSILSPSLLAHILTAKFNDHLPFYRQSQIMDRRHGIKITRSTLCNWAELGATTLQPLYNLIAGDIRKSNSLNIDESPVDYLDPGTGSTSKGYFWVYRSQSAGVLYDWQLGRAHTCLNDILTDGGETFSGILQCDGYSAYSTWVNSQKDIVLTGCWAHARRKFTEALPHTQDAALILQYIQQLYQEENKYKQWIEQSPHPPEVIIYYRRRHHKKLLNDLRQKLHHLKPQHLPKSKMGKALTYAINQWHKLCLAVKHSPSLDNNGAENAVRPLKLGAKNWLFIGSEDTGWRSAIIYTLIENCRLLGHDPYEYLKWVFEKLPTMTNQDDLRPLLPTSWVKQQEQKKAPSLAV